MFQTRTSRGGLAILAGLSLLIGATGVGHASPPESRDPAAPGLEGMALLMEEKEAPKPDKSHYPWRLPEWLWQDEARRHLVSPATRKAIVADIAAMGALAGIDRQAADAREEKMVRTLSRSFTVSDLIYDVPVHRDDARGVLLAAQIDPAFSDAQRMTLEKAVSLFARYALDERVLQEAFDQSVAEPDGIPERYEMKDGKPVLDEDGNPKISGSYKHYRSTRSRPRDVDAFRRHLGSALGEVDGDSSFLAISRYTGNVWWGGGWYNWFHREPQQLSRLSPPRGYLYINLNADKLTEGVPGFDDPVFWASKMAHEVLHNLSYWHPSYKDPTTRDQMNPPGKKAFIVSYEQAVWKIADAERDPP